MALLARTKCCKHEFLGGFLYLMVVLLVCLVDGWFSLLDGGVLVCLVDGWFSLFNGGVLVCLVDGGVFTVFVRLHLSLFLQVKPGNNLVLKGLVDVVHGGGLVRLEL